MPGLGGLRARPLSPAGVRAAACPPCSGALSWCVGSRDPREPLSPPRDPGPGRLAHHAEAKDRSCAHIFTEGHRDPADLVRRRRRRPRPRAPGLVGGRHPARQAPPLLRPPRRHRRPRDRRQRRQGRPHLGQGRGQAGLPPQRLPRRPALHQLRRAARGEARPSWSVARCAACCPRTPSAARCSASCRSTPAPITRTRPRSPSRSTCPRPAAPADHAHRKDQRRNARTTEPDHRTPQAGGGARPLPPRPGRHHGQQAPHRAVLHLGHAPHAGDRAACG